MSDLYNSQEKDDIAYVRDMRKGVVSHLVKDGLKDMSSEEMDTMLATLTSMEKGAQTTAAFRQKSGNDDAQNDNNAILAELLKTINVADFLDSRVQIEGEVVVKELPAELDTETVPGETSIQDDDNLIELFLID